LSEAGAGRDPAGFMFNMPILEETAMPKECANVARIRRLFKDFRARVASG